MTIEERAAQAAQYKETGACNCTQAVIKVFEDKISTDEKELIDRCSYDGGCPDRRKRHTKIFQRNPAEIFRKKRSYHLQGTQRCWNRKSPLRVPGMCAKRGTGTGRDAGGSVRYTGQITEIYFIQN